MILGRGQSSTRPGNSKKLRLRTNSLQHTDVVLGVRINGHFVLGEDEPQF